MEPPRRVYPWDLRGNKCGTCSVAPYPVIGMGVNYHDTYNSTGFVPAGRLTGLCSRSPAVFEVA